MTIESRAHLFPPWLRAHWQTVLFGAVVALLVVRTAWRLRLGINPDSLWLDDQWVAALILHASFAEWLELMPPAPLGFLALLKTITSIFGWGHWQLQLLPILCALAQIPLIGWIAWCASGRVSLGMLAAILLSGSSTFLVFALRIKQYTLEGLIALILIALAMRCAQNPRAMPFAVVILACVFALPLSFTAVPVGMVIVTVLALHVLFQRSEAAGATRRRVIGWSAMYFLAALSWLWMVQANQATAAMYEFWWRFYLPIGDGAELWEFSRFALKAFLTGGLPPMLGWLVAAVPLAVVLLFLRKSTRLLGLAFVLFYGGMLTLSAIERYPIGGGRTDIFSYPITMLAVVAGIWAVARYITILPVIVLTIVIGCMVLFFPHPAVHYPVNADRETVETMEALVTADGDGLIIGPDSSWAVACYGSLPIEFVPSPASTNGFVVQPRRAKTIAVPRRMRVEDGSTAPDGDLIQPIMPLVERGTDRIWVLVLHARAWWIAVALESQGYRRRDVPGGSTIILLFERDSTQADTPGSEGGAER